MNVRSLMFVMFDGFRSIIQNVRIRSELRSHGLGLIVFDVVRLGVIEETLGRPTTERILLVLSKLIRNLKGSMSATLIAVKSVGDDFSLFVRLPSITGGVSREMFLHDEALTIKRLLEAKLMQELQLNLSVRLHVGSALIQVPPESSFQAAIYNAMKLATHNAKNVDPESGLRILEFEDILSKRSFYSMFQPIVSLRSGLPFGVEALTRGPQGSFFHTPENLFDFAQTLNKLMELDTVVAETSIATYGGANPGCKLFLNLDSRTILHDTVTVDTVLSWLAAASVTPEEVVIEVTERNWVADYATFNAKLDVYRRIGFSIAVDDVGMGYSSLQAITELKPDFIKIDRSLIQHMDREMVRSVMLETLMDFAQKVNCLVIAEGIETEGELEKAIQLGIHYGQGFLIAKPGLKVLDKVKDISDVIARNTVDVPAQQGGTAILVGRVTRAVTTFDDTVTVAEVARYFHDNPRDYSVVVMKSGYPIGLVMRDKLLRQLATQYGVPLYWHRSIRKLMDANALTVDVSTQLDLVSRLAMERDEDKVYDSIVVTNDGALEGIITIQDILSTINTVHMEQARGSNPLTGLPGNRSIKHEIQKWMSSGKSFFMVYADIDYFKWYNDRFGFHRGDLVIQFLAEILSSVCNTETDECFVGHIGGDDFVILTNSPDPLGCCSKIIGRFDGEISNFYPRPDDNLSDANDYLAVYDRNGNQVSNAGLTLSLCLLECPVTMTEITLEDVSEYVASLKKSAKDRAGSTCISASLPARANPSGLSQA
jgi:EAL domain-containing protein (putative c-di-GMP-specific phosphodiesterase class I)/GGDEF domain-containing protein